MIHQRVPKALLGWMGSLADPTRLRILTLLEQRELGVAELCGVVQMPQSTVSRHLKVLSDEGWTRSRRDGTANLYRMTLDELEPPARKLWVLTRDGMRHWPALEQDRLRLERVLASRQRDPRKLFESAAGEWDAMRQTLYGRGVNAAALLGLLPADWVVADLGCGSGALTAELAQAVRRVMGVDRSPAMLKAARKRCRGLANVELRKGDLEAPPIDDAACDAALLVLVLTYVQDVDAALRQAARVTRPAGRLVIVDLLEHDRDDFRRQLGQHWSGFAPDELAGWIRQAGFDKVRTRRLAPEAQAKGPALLLATAVRG